MCPGQRDCLYRFYCYQHGHLSFDLRSLNAQRSAPYGTSFGVHSSHLLDADLSRVINMLTPATHHHLATRKRLAGLLPASGFLRRRTVCLEKSWHRRRIATKAHHAFFGCSGLESRQIFTDDGDETVILSMLERQVARNIESIS